MFLPFDSLWLDSLWLDSSWLCSLWLGSLWLDRLWLSRLRRAGAQQALDVSPEDVALELDMRADAVPAVSYTHLTLPTSDLV